MDNVQKSDKSSLEYKEELKNILIFVLQHLTDEVLKSHSNKSSRSQVEPHISGFKSSCSYKDVILDQLIQHRCDKCKNVTAAHPLKAAHEVVDIPNQLDFVCSKSCKTCQMKTKFGTSLDPSQRALEKKGKHIRFNEGSLSVKENEKQEIVDHVQTKEPLSCSPCESQNSRVPASSFHIPKFEQCAEDKKCYGIPVEHTIRQETPQELDILQETKPQILKVVTNIENRLRELEFQNDRTSEQDKESQFRAGTAQPQVTKQQTLDLMIKATSELKDEITKMSDMRNSESQESLRETQSIEFEQFPCSSMCLSESKLKSEILHLVMNAASKLKSTEEFNSSPDINIKTEPHARKPINCSKSDNMGKVSQAEKHITEQNNFNIGMCDLKHCNESYKICTALLTELIQNLEKKDIPINRQTTEEFIRHSIINTANNVVTQLNYIQDCKENIYNTPPFLLPKLLSIQEKTAQALDIIITTATTLIKEQWFSLESCSSELTNEPVFQRNMECNISNEIKQNIIQLVRNTSEKIMQQVDTIEVNSNQEKENHEEFAFCCSVKQDLERELQQQILQSIVTIAEKLKSEVMCRDNTTAMSKDDEKQDIPIHRQSTEEFVRDSIINIANNVVTQMNYIQDCKENIYNRPPFLLPKLLKVQEKTTQALEIIITAATTLIREQFSHEPYSSAVPTDEQTFPNNMECCNIYEDIKQNLIQLVKNMSEQIMQQVTIAKVNPNLQEERPEEFDLHLSLKEDLQRELQQQILQRIITVAEKLRSEVMCGDTTPPMSTDEINAHTRENESNATLNNVLVNKSIQMPTIENILNIVLEILNDLRARSSTCQETLAQTAEEHSNIYLNKSAHELCNLELCSSQRDDSKKFSTTDSEKEFGRISYHNIQTPASSFMNERLNKGTDPCDHCFAASTSQQDDEHSSKLHKDNIKETNSILQATDAADVHKDSEGEYKDKLKKYIHDLVKLSLQEMCEKKRKEYSSGEIKQDDQCSQTISNAEYQSLIIIIEAFLDKLITMSCECQFPLEKLYLLLDTITNALENSSLEEFVQVTTGIAREKAKGEEKVESFKSWIMGHLFDSVFRATQPFEDVCDALLSAETQGGNAKDDICVADVIPLKKTKESIIQTEEPPDICYDRIESPLVLIKKDMTQQQLKHLVDIWFQEFKDFYNVFSRQSHGVIKNDFLLASNREKLELLNNLIIKNSSSLECIERQLRESQELQCECMSIHSMYLNTDIRGKGERETIYNKLLHVKKQLDDLSKVKDSINEEIKVKLNTSLITKLTRILNCFQHTLQGVEYKIQVLEHELQCVKRLSEAFFAKRRGF